MWAAAREGVGLVDESARPVMLSFFFWRRGGSDCTFCIVGCIHKNHTSSVTCGINWALEQCALCGHSHGRLHADMSLSNSSAVVYLSRVLVFAVGKSNHACQVSHPIEPFLQTKVCSVPCTISHDFVHCTTA